MAEIERLKQQIESNPEDADAILQLANLNYDIRNWARAKDLYLRWLELRPADPGVLTDLGVAYRGLGEFPEAMKRFDEAQKLQAGHWQSMFNQVVVLSFDLHDHERAEAVLAQLRTLQPDNPEVERLGREVEQAKEQARRSGSA
jgi:Flp pilus assembly protein TadD